MGLFGGNKDCIICGEKAIFKTLDGKICRNCTIKILGPKISVNNISSLKNKSINELNAMISNREKSAQLSDVFVESCTYGPISFDFKNRLFSYNIVTLAGFGKTELNREVFKLDEVMSYSVLEDGDTLTSGGLGRAAVGAIAFGGVGAVVGAVTGKKRTKKEIHSLNLLINLSNDYKPTLNIPFLVTKTKARSQIYINATNDIQNCVSSLERAIKSDTKSEQLYESNTIDVTDELRKFKSLLDDGIITQDEFEMKKKELLGF